MHIQLPTIALLALGFAAMLPTQAIGSSLRCGNKLVLDGDTRDAVSNNCGPPVDISRSVILRRPFHIHQRHAVYFDDEVTEVPVEIWLYNFGPHRFMSRLRFVDGILQDIEIPGVR